VRQGSLAAACITTPAESAGFDASIGRALPMPREEPRRVRTELVGPKSRSRPRDACTAAHWHWGVTDFRRNVFNSKQGQSAVQGRSETQRRPTKSPWPSEIRRYQPRMENLKRGWRSSGNGAIPPTVILPLGQHGVAEEWDLCGARWDAQPPVQDRARHGPHDVRVVRTGPVQEELITEF